MFVDLTDDQKSLQAELRDYFAALMTPEVKQSVRTTESMRSDAYKDLIRKVGSDGWLGVGWPVEWGGKGFTPIEQYIFFNESQAAGCPIPFLTTNTVGPTIREFGTRSRRSSFCRRSSPGTCTSPSAIPSPQRALTSPRCRPAR